MTLLCFQNLSPTYSDLDNRQQNRCGAEYTSVRYDLCQTEIIFVHICIINRMNLLRFD